MMQAHGQFYVRYFNYTYQRSGTLLEGRYKSYVVDAKNYLLICQRYIELNPVRARIVDSPADYYWSSYQTNGLGRTSAMCTPNPLYLSLGNNTPARLLAYRKLFKAHIDDDITLIRDATNKGLAIGNDRFVKQIELLSVRRVTEKNRGPKSEAETE
jgi:putative transposase